MVSIDAAVFKIEAVHVADHCFDDNRVVITRKFDGVLVVLLRSLVRIRENEKSDWDSVYLPVPIEDLIEVLGLSAKNSLVHLKLLVLQLDGQVRVF